MTRSVTVRIERIDPATPAAQALLALSDAYFAELYPPESNHLENAAELGRPNVIFVGAYVGTALAGCGAAKIMSDEGRYGEIKRLFVPDAYRGQGISKAIMRYLEDALRRQGVAVVRLETGVRQPAALALYRRLSYAERGPFGAYREDPLSVFMEKRLA